MQFLQKASRRFVFTQTHVYVVKSAERPCITFNALPLPAK